MWFILTFGESDGECAVLFNPSVRGNVVSRRVNAGVEESDWYLEDMNHGGTIAAAWPRTYRLGNCTLEPV